MAISQKLQAKIEREMSVVIHTRLLELVEEGVLPKSTSVEEIGSPNFPAFHVDAGKEVFAVGLNIG